MVVVSVWMLLSYSPPWRAGITTITATLGSSVACGTPSTTPSYVQLCSDRRVDTGSSCTRCNGVYSVRIFADGSTAVASAAVDVDYRKHIVLALPGMACSF